MPNLVGRTPDQSVVHCWGQRLCTSQMGSTTGQIAYECPISTKFCRKNPWPECNTSLGSKVTQGSTRGQIAQECPVTTKFGLKKHWPEQYSLLRSKVLRGQPEVKLFRYAEDNKDNLFSNVVLKSTMFTSYGILLVFWFCFFVLL